jgi:hypothetical protein
MVMHAFSRTAPAVLLALVLAGCGSSDRPRTSAGPAATPAEGYTLTGPNQVVVEVPGMV